MDDRTVTGRVMAVLEAVADLDDSATLATVTRRTGIPKPTVRRITADLVAREILERHGVAYRLGPRLLEFGIRAAAQHGLRQAAMPHVQDLFARTGEIAWLSAFTGSTNLLLASAFGRNRAADMRRPWPTNIRTARFLNSAAGLVLLASRSDLAEEMRRGALPRLTPYSLTTWARVTSAIRAVRDDGFAIEHEQLMLGYNCIAASVRDGGQRVIGVIGVVGRTNFAAQRLARPLLATAADIEGALPHV